MVEIYIPEGRRGQQALASQLTDNPVTNYSSENGQLLQPVSVEEELKGEGENLEVPLPQTCDVKEALIVKLQELDTKIYMLEKSNKEIIEELADDPEVEEYIGENKGIIVRTKDEILRILNAFMQAGIDIDKENVLTKMVHRHLYMPDDSDIVMKKSSAPTLSPARQIEL